MSGEPGSVKLTNTFHPATTCCEILFIKDTSNVGNTFNIADLAVKNGSLLYSKDGKVWDPPVTGLGWKVEPEETNRTSFGFYPQVFWITDCP